MSKSGLTKYQDELLEILVEECGEIIQEKSKIFRFGMDEQSHHIIGKSHRECLTQELGDMLGMIQLLIDSDIGITYNDVEEAANRKKKKVVNWMTHKNPDDAKNTLFKLWSKPAKTNSTGEVMKKAMEVAKKQLNNYKDAK